MLETISARIADQVAVVTLNRPERLNAYTVQMGIELFETFHRLDLDDAVRAIVVTGAGRHFCAGADLESGGDTFAGDRTWEATAARESRAAPWNMRTPIIAAINGAAVGIGATLPLQWDIRIASERAKIGFVFTRRGILPEAASTWILPRMIGIARASELMLTGRIIDAGEALEFGLVSRVVPPDQLLPTALELGRDIARNTAPTSVAITKRLLWRQLMENDPRRAKQREDALFYWSGKQLDAAEGVESFLEKRDPVWKMSAANDLPDSIAEMSPLPDSD